MKPITLFSWGYWGWGNSTKQLVRAVDAVEESRGFKPPIFVDVRFQRSGQAPGFHGSKFEKLLGPNRYRWMKSLGNSNIPNPKLKHLAKIADPKSATFLLELAVDEAANDRRIIFFCACECPTACHRSKVAGLVLKAARKRGIGIEIVEWPGGHPIEKGISVPAAVFRKVKNGQVTIPLKRGVDLAEVAGLPWGSIVSLESDGDFLHRLSGPAAYRNDQWCLPVIHQWDDASVPLIDYKRESPKTRKYFGYNPQRSF
jgi:Protein of unknown function, DUF488